MGDQGDALGIISRHGIEASDVDIINITNNNHEIDVKKGDIFFTYTWWATLNAIDISDYQASRFNIVATPIVYFVQDYEPHFYPFSAAHVHALNALNLDRPLWAIINSSELDGYLTSQGHSFDRKFLIKPSLNGKLRDYIGSISVNPIKKKKIFVYGRPGVQRNCFEAAVSSLKCLVRDHPEYLSWEFVSAGLPHVPEPLGPNCRLNSLGKLSLKDYCQELIESAVGLSLMASPHPSYPPLEMANFGLLTITNDYPCKSMEKYHENILSTRDIRDASIAQLMHMACQKFQENKNIGWENKNLDPEFDRLDNHDLVKNIVTAFENVIWN
jgi:hypothetical protein